MALRNLRNQIAVHEANAAHHRMRVDQLNRAKTDAVRSKNLESARGIVREKHKATQAAARYEQLRDMCQNMLNGIDDGSVIRETVGVLNEVQAAFRNVDMDMYHGQIGEIADSMSELQGDVVGINEVIASTSYGPEVEESELEAELAALVDGSENVEKDPKYYTPTPQNGPNYDVTAPPPTFPDVPRGSPRQPPMAPPIHTSASARLAQAYRHSIRETPN